MRPVTGCLLVGDGAGGEEGEVEGAARAGLRGIQEAGVGAMVEVGKREEVKSRLVEESGEVA